MLSMGWSWRWATWSIRMRRVTWTTWRSGAWSTRTTAWWWTFAWSKNGIGWSLKCFISNLEKFHLRWDLEWLRDFLALSTLSSGLPPGAFAAPATSPEFFKGDDPSILNGLIVIFFLSSRSLIAACFSLVLMATVCATISISRARPCSILFGGESWLLELDFPGAVEDVVAISEMIFFSNDSFAFAANSDFSALRRFNSLSWLRSIGKNSSTLSFDLLLGASFSELSRSLVVGWSFTTGPDLRFLSFALGLSKISRYFSGLRRAGE